MSKASLIFWPTLERKKSKLSVESRGQNQSITVKLTGAIENRQAKGATNLKFNTLEKGFSIANNP